MSREQVKKSGVTLYAIPQKYRLKTGFMGSPPFKGNRMTPKVLSVLIFSFGICWAVKSVEVIADSAFLYKEESGKSDYSHVLRKGQILSLLPQDDNMFQLRLKVKTEYGVEGWVLKKAMEKTDKDPTAQDFSMEEKKIIGYLEMPQAVYILDVSDTSAVPILLHRSFQDLLITRIDRETFERLYDPVVAAEK